MSESEVQTLMAEFSGLEKLLTERFDNIEKDFADVKDRLKRAKESKKKLVVWIIILLLTILLSSFLGAFFAPYFSLLGK